MIHRDRDGDIAVVRMERGKVNALDMELLQAICDEFESLKHTDCRAVVLTGTGSSFSAGVDLFRVIEGGKAYLDTFLPLLSNTFQTVFDFPGPVIGAANGHAIAGGAVLLCCCDRRFLANTQARVGIPELYVGVPFPSVAMEIMRFSVGNDHLQQVFLSGETVLPAEAQRLGLVDDLSTPEILLETAIECARRYLSVPQATYALSKRQLHQPVLDAIATATALFEGEVNTIWTALPTLDAIQRYLDQLFKK